MKLLFDDTVPRRYGWVGVPCLVFIVVAVFFRVRGFDFVSWDDDRMLFLNPHVQGMTGEHIKWMFTDSTYNRLYMPLGWLFYAMTVGLFGLAPGAHHLVNLAIHIVNAILVFAVILEILHRVVPGRAGESRLFATAACMGAIFWAIHPLRVEVVAWVGARVHGMAAVFAILSLWFYLRSHAAGLSRRQMRAGYWISVGCYALSILVFPAALMLPAVLLILDVYVLKSGGERGGSTGWKWKVLAGKIPYAVIAGCSAGISLWGRAHAPLMDSSPTLGQFGIVARVAQAFYVWAYYVWVEFAPLHLSPVYTRLYDVSPAHAIFMLSGGAVLAVSVLGFLFRRRHPYLWAAWLCHLVMLAPFLGLTEHPDTTSDRYSYLVGVIVCIVGAAGFVRMWRWPAAERVRPVFLVACGGILFACAALSFAQTAIWENSVTLFNHVLAELGTDPHRAEFKWRLGNFYLDHGQPADAVLLFDESLRVSPDDMKALYSKGLAILQLAKEDGSAIDRNALYLRAAASFDRAEAVGHTAVSLKWAGFSFAMAGQLASAEDRLGRALAMEPQDSQTRLFLATVFHQDQKEKEALAELTKAVEHDPTLAATRDQMMKAWAESAATTGAPASGGR